MKTLFAGIAGAVVIGALSGGALRADPYQLGDRPRGPQQIYSLPTEEGYHEAFGYAAIEFPSGPFADFIIGTDWLPGGRHSQPVVTYAATYELEDYDTMRERLYAKYLAPYFPDFPDPPPAPAAELAIESEPAANSASEPVEIVFADDEARRQVDDLAHRTDEAALFHEPAA